MLQPRWIEQESPTHPRTCQVNRDILTAARGGESGSEEHLPPNLQAAGTQGGPGVVAQLRPGAVELAADVGAGQPDSTAGAVAGGGEPAAQENAQADLQSVGLQGGPGVVAQLRPGAVEHAAGCMYHPGDHTVPCTVTVRTWHHMIGASCQALRGSDHRRAPRNTLGPDTTAPRSARAAKLSIFMDKTLGQHDATVTELHPQGDE